jgi:DNA primase
MAGDVEEVKQKTDIVSIISEHLQLKKAGRNFKGLCPFHNEKTPSFIVSPELQIYKCFGCGESGDVFTFLEKNDGMDFSEALNYLADRAGVKLTRVNVGAKSEKEAIYETNKLVARLYKYLLLKHKLGESALVYLKRDRGLKMSTIETFGLGYSPNDPALVVKTLVDKKGVKKNDLVSAGLTYERSGSIFDRFSGRVIFPLIDHRGNICGFAGRVLPGSKTKMAKYVNSPETPAYHKSDMFYALNIAKEHIKKSKTAIIVEGELDAISLWQIGIKNVVAIKGSALTENQASLIRRFAEKIVLALDSDEAGQEAARRALVVSQKYDLEVNVVSLKKYKDPDEAARNDPEYLKKMIEKAAPGWDFVFKLIFAKYNPDTAGGKAKISKEVAPLLGQIEDKIIQAHYVNRIAKKLGVEPEAVFGQIKGKTDLSKPAEKAEVVKKDRREILEERLLAIILQLGTDYAKDEFIKHFSISLYRKISQEFV